MSKRQNSEDVTINLTPMIDVVFLLVIFFMVGSKFSEAESRIKVNVPSVGEMKSLARVPDERVVAIAVDGTITLDESPITLDQLTRTLQSEHANYPGMRVAVRGEASGSVQQMVEVLHAVRVAGVDQIGIATQRMRR
ncbi:biopolymer transporter ExbD [Rubripirellula amarantea]|uniref:Biopolymer transport protein ExbD n=1 Tax=Rubripirellula amarantea TaxID=2527999 RepID=A0A5C5WG66_9BACT|nr:biopolymer transporter ExbD [Rubripirellula amarantea]MDA8743263.1 biopolymer transporter ExbD [Rubripirellula amarantea]TWT49527.1 biopolymer transport protein ExbD [Rubripirellula amarantea]